MVESTKLTIPIGVSARHVHLSTAHIKTLFGYEKLTMDFDLSQPGQFAATERVTLKTAKNVIQHVRILGPARDASQVEISKTDSFLLGIQPPTRLSGDLHGSEGITLEGPKGTVTLVEGCIVAQAHIHMHSYDAEVFQVADKQLVSVRVKSERPVTFHDVIIRVSDAYALDMHIDTDEGNAAAIQKGMTGEILIT